MKIYKSRNNTYRRKKEKKKEMDQNVWEITGFKTYTREKQDTNKKMFS